MIRLNYLQGGYYRGDSKIIKNHSFLLCSMYNWIISHIEYFIFKIVYLEWEKMYTSWMIGGYWEKNLQNLFAPKKRNHKGKFTYRSSEFSWGNKTAVYHD